MNLLKETIEDIEEFGHDPSEIKFIGSRYSGHSCTWEQFIALADFDYDSGYGSQKIAKDLEIVFSDGSNMTRSEYDGSEDWQCSKPFVKPPVDKPIKKLGGDDVMWSTLEDMNRPGGKYGDSK